MEFAASLIAVVGLADQVIRCCTRYISAVKDCPSDIRVLLIETSTLKSVIENLEALSKTGTGTGSNPGLEKLLLGLGRNDGPIKGCLDCLAEIDKLLPNDRAKEDIEGKEDQGGPGGKRKKRRALQPTIERLAWPLRETKAKKLVDELKRFRENISLALVVDLSRASRQIDSKLQQISDHLDGSFTFLSTVLDESKNRANILRAVKTLRDVFPNLKTLVMSREEIDIKEAMKSLCAETVSLSNTYVDEDIATYIRNELAANARLCLYPPWLKQEIKQILVKGACGMFRWASCQIEVLSRLHTVSDIRKALSDLPRGLDATYERILLGIPEEHKHRAKRALLHLLSSGSTRVSVIAEAIMVDIDAVTFDPADRILKPKEFIAEMCTCLVRVDETEPQRPRLFLAHYTVKEYLYSDRIMDSPAAYFHSSDELAEYQESMASLVYLLNISYEGVPSAKEFLSATASKQKEYAASVNASYPLLEEASSSWMISSGSGIKDAALRAKVDSLFLKLFYPSPRHSKWIAWRGLTWTITNDEWLHPVWSASSLAKADPHDVALTLACYFNRPSIVSTILAAKRQAAASNSAGAPLVLDEFYAAFWKQIYRKDASATDAKSNNPLQGFDMQLHPEDYLPSGTLLEIALRFDATECTRLVLLTCLQDISSYVATTPSGRRLSLLSVALKACPDSWQMDFRLRYLNMLIELGASVNPSTATDSSMSVTETPLQSAAMLMHKKAVSILLDAGADVNGVSANCGCDESQKGGEDENGPDQGPAKGKEVVTGQLTTCWGHKSPLRIVREIMAARSVERSEVEELLRLNGALDFEWSHSLIGMS